jgi:hypothetical protein
VKVWCVRRGVWGSEGILKRWRAGVSRRGKLRRRWGK